MRKAEIEEARKAIEDSIKHWQHIISLLSKPIEVDNEIGSKVCHKAYRQPSNKPINKELYRGKNCPLCKTFYVADMGLYGTEDSNCWACPLAYHRWQESGDEYAFSGTCAEEWTAFHDTMKEINGVREAMPTWQSLKKAESLLKVLEGLKPTARFDTWEKYEKEVLHV